MNSLKFIENQIKEIDKRIDYYKRQIDEDSMFKTFIESFTSTIKELTNLKNTLLQIKTELEAWEVVKHLIYKRKMGEERFIQVMGGVYNEGQCWTSGINPYETLKKALEVEDDISK